MNNKSNYELVVTKNGIGYSSFYIIIEKINEESMISIIKEFKNNYTQDILPTGFQIGFFLNSDRKDALNYDYTSAKAMYHENYNNNLSELYIKDIDKIIEIK